MPASASDPVPDHAVRLALAQRLHENAFVEAGAGSGKTSVLVERYVALLDAGVAIDSIAAITFTDKAAAELRDRIRSRVGRERGVLLAGATIGTIHGFARSLLARHPFDLGLPPDFTVITDVEAFAELDRRAVELLDVLYDDPALEVALSYGLAAGVRPEHLRNVIAAVHADHDRFPGALLPVHPVPEIDPSTIIDAATVAIDAGRTCRFADDPLARHVRLIEAWVETVRSVVDPLELLRLLSDDRPLGGSAPIVVKNRGSGQAWSQVSKPAMIGLLERVEAARLALVAAARRAALAAVLPVIVDATVAARDERRRQGRLEFLDLLVFARELLRRSAVLAQARARFRYLLVDEFQDTDPLQLDILTAIAGTDADPFVLPWSERSIRPSALFVVGDPKQSIYRFRRADVASYRAAGALLGAGVAHRLEANFRSVPGVLSWVDTVVGTLFETVAEHHDVYSRLTAVRPAGESTAVDILGDPVEGRLAEVRTREAAETAAAIVELVRGATARHRFADIALLLPTRTGLAMFERALDAAAVPYRVESRSLVYATQEVRDLANILRAVVDPSDHVAQVGALRSAVMACSDRDLATWRRAGGSWDGRAPRPEAIAVDHPVAEARTVLSELASASTSRGVAATVLAVTRRLTMHEAAFAFDRPRDHWRRIEFVRQQAVAFERTGGSMRAFVDWLDRQRDEQALDHESIAVDTDDDAVRVLTVHGAKGLEFPVVVLAGLNVEPPPFDTALLWDKPDEAGRNAFAVKVGRLDDGSYTENYRLLRDREVEALRAERQRLLYVAATRARDRLIVNLARPAKPGKSLADDIVRALDTAGVAIEPWRPPVPAPVFVPVASPQQLDLFAEPPGPLQSVTQVHAGAPDLAEFDRERAALFARQRPAAVRATAFAHDDEDDDLLRRRRGGAGRAGTAIGRAVHRVLQGFDAEAEAAAEGIADRVADVTRLAAVALASPAVAAASRAKRVWRELYVGAPIEGVVVEGFVDLLYEDVAGAFTVVDYKTDHVEGAPELARLAERYRRQGAAYCAVLAGVVGRPVERFVLVFPAAGDGCEIEVGGTELEAAIAELKARLSAGEVL
ncbi:MAG: UvrD-helicase domain-containing protein [Acidimicrobiia bacterium]